MADTLFLFSLLFFIAHRMLRYLHLYQQEVYKNGRFCSRVITMRAFDTKGSLIIFITYLISLTLQAPLFLTLFSSALLLIAAKTEPDPRKMGKVRLNMTERAKTLFYTSLFLFTFFYIALWPEWLSQIIFIQIAPLFLVGANLLTYPFELRKQQRFLQEARERITEVAPFIIGITGSYGKTSTKYALAKILQVTLGPTFWPPRSFNTLMGITREIRERLIKGYTYAIIEMGAYAIGSIKALTELTPPRAAIITGVGTCHLDRFGSQENIALAKAELAQALRQQDILVCNGDNIGSRSIAEKHKTNRTFLYGFDNTSGDLDCFVSRLSFSEKGTHFTLHWKSGTEKGNSKESVYEGFTPLLGKTALSNALAAFTMACALGADPEFVLAVIATLEPVDNRLQVKKEEGVYYVHDAFNSNLSGFIAAVEVLAALPAKRRIVMTPGMIELGSVQEEENFEAAKHAGSCCSLALVVGDTNKQALIQGFKKAGLTNEQIILCATRQEAFNHLAAVKMPNDAILIENDLTDIYEKTAKF